MATHDVNGAPIDIPEHLWVTNYVVANGGSPTSLMLGLLTIEASLRATQKALGITETPIDLSELLARDDD